MQLFKHHTLPTTFVDFRALATHYATQLKLCYPPDPTSFSRVRIIHAHIITSGFISRGCILVSLINVYCKHRKVKYARRLFDEMPQPSIVASTTMVSAYCSLGNLKESRRIFDEIPVCVRDVVCYNAMITGYNDNGDGTSAVRLFWEMLRDGVRLDHFTYSAVLSALSLIADDSRQCHQLHCAVVKSGLGHSTPVLNSLMSLYVKCVCSPSVVSSSLLGEARKLFDEMEKKDDLTLTTMITGYSRNDDLASARQVFDSTTEKPVAVWNAMISGYVHHGLYLDAFELFTRMNVEGTLHDEYTYANVLGACASFGLFGLGKEIHARILRKELKDNVRLPSSISNALVTLYYKSGKIDEARHIFEEMPVKNIISWNSMLTGYVTAGQVLEAKNVFSRMPEKNHLTWTVMIAAYAQNELGEEGVRLLNQMRHEGFQPCDFCYAGAVTACSNLVALGQGRQLHSQVICLGHESSISVGNALITMYGRCGSVEDSHLIFTTMNSVDSVSWNAMIAAFGLHGHGAQALKLFQQMLEVGILPDRITFLTILTACSHAGLVHEGRRHFDSMRKYQIVPGEDHYTRMIDLFCRAGKFSEAEELINTMPFEPKAPILEAMLAGCQIHGNLDLGCKIAKKLLNLIPENDGAYILLSNIYAAAGQWNDVARVRALMRDRGVKKEPACSQWQILG
ncbi:hypothetical protein RND81_03G239700 [Saponaria officinalis]|uniref:Pentatricopeptide repeat-containing protein n=1 Tax=Saponaria officinalis TaxID=3572 RepID=A0AAW1MCH0_SAPOF